MADDAPLAEANQIDGAPHPRETRRLIGQDAAERAFLDAWTGGRLHHAWLLRGPQGVGKATLAYRVARALIAQPAEGGLFGDGPEIPQTLTAPEGCPVQARIEAQSETSLYVLRRNWNMDAKPPRLQTQIAVENVRAMRRFLQLSAADGGWRVVIVDSADEMNRSSANALLKYLEEPPPQTMFLMISHSPAGLLPTIRSRCRTLDLGPLSPSDLSEALAGTGAALPSDSETALTELSGGSVGQALHLIAGEGLDHYAVLVRLIGAGGIDRKGMTGLAEQCAGRQAADRYASVLSLIQILMARLARAAATGTPPREAAPGEQKLIERVACHPDQAHHWADALSRISATTRHAVAVNLDPAQCVIDTLLEIDATLGRVRAVAV